ncbi:hypothetical protein [Schleiferia thermophila]|nr:hypothetical protein [Schleiferia thermophila]
MNITIQHHTHYQSDNSPSKTPLTPIACPTSQPQACVQYDPP